MAPRGQDTPRQNIRLPRAKIAAFVDNRGNAFSFYVNFWIQVSGKKAVFLR
jgi:hypothetical protein